MHGMIDFQLAGFINDPPRVLPVKNRSDVWARLRLSLRLPHYERDGEMVPGSVRYYTVVAFGPLARQIERESLVVGDWVIVRVRDIRASAWVNDRGQAKGSVEMIAESIEFRPARDVVAALVAVVRDGDPVPADAG